MNSSEPTPERFQEQLFEGFVASDSANRLGVARVLLEDNALELDYSVPESLKEALEVGSRVQVSVQGRPQNAVVLQILESSPYKKLKPLGGMIGSSPVFTPTMIALGQWISLYYLCQLRQVLKTMLPVAVRNKPGSFLSDFELKVTDTFSADPDLAFQRLKSAPVQGQMLEMISTQEKGRMVWSELRKTFPQGNAALKALVQKGWITQESIRMERDPFQDEEFVASQPLNLTEEQSQVFQRILTVLRDPQEEKKPMLLLGVTGSGKTEVYLQAIQEVLQQGKTALVLVPEISLTPQTIDRFKSRFSDKKERIAVLHSHLSDGERHDEWFKIHEKRADIVIGARSAIFAPIQNVGLIIVDEEHEPSYKQDEVPRYHARDVAVVRAKMDQALCLLGSATPSLESYRNACSGKYEMLEMTRRTDGKSMPMVHVVDMRLEKKRTKDGVAILSEKLRMAIQARLDRGEQTILFLNRRGFNTALSCIQCGTVCQCPDCAVSLTFHKQDGILICHVCGMRRLPPKRCEACGDPSLLYGGYGTERAEEAIRNVFKAAKIARVDTDTMQRKNQLRDTLKSFRQQKLDILIGTQMIAKGLDFPNVTLVGVLNADLALNLPDFRAAERTFQLLTQVAGRAGRGELRGEVFIQTFAPHSPAVQFSRKADFHGFADQELEMRKFATYPPYGHVVLVGCRGFEENHAEFALETLAKRLRKSLSSEMFMGEPCPSPLAKSHGQHRFQLLIKTLKIKPLLALLRQVMAEMSYPEGVVVTWDVDAVSLL